MDTVYAARNISALQLRTPVISEGRISDRLVCILRTSPARPSTSFKPTLFGGVLGARCGLSYVLMPTTRAPTPLAVLTGKCMWATP